MARQQRAQTLRVRTKHTSGLSYGQESGPGISWRSLICHTFYYIAQHSHRLHPDLIIERQKNQQEHFFLEGDVKLQYVA